MRVPVSPSLRACLLASSIAIDYGSASLALLKRV